MKLLDKILDTINYIAIGVIQLIGLCCILICGIFCFTLISILYTFISILYTIIAVYEFIRERLNKIKKV